MYQESNEAAVLWSASTVASVQLSLAQSVHLCSNGEPSGSSTDRQNRILSAEEPSSPLLAAVCAVLSQTPILPSFLLMSVGTSPTVRPYLAIPRRCHRDVKWKKVEFIL